ncbi:MAG: beta-propeller domain-containing protein [Thermoproteota archaeon]
MGNNSFHTLLPFSAAAAVLIVVLLPYLGILKPYSVETVTVTETATVGILGSSYASAAEHAASANVSRVELTRGSLGLTPRSWNDLVSLISAYAHLTRPRGVYYPLLATAARPITTMPTATIAVETPASTPSRVVPAYSTTNVQVAGVDEQDIVKLNGTHLFVARPPDIVETYRVVPPEALSLVDRFNVSGLLEKFVEPIRLVLVVGNETQLLEEVRPRFSVWGMYVDGGSLVVVAVEWRSAMFVYSLPARTWVIRYKPGIGIENVTYVEGEPLQSRLWNGTLVIVSSAPTAVSPSSIVLPTVRGKLPSPDRVHVMGPPEVYTIVTAFDVESWDSDVQVFVGPRVTTMYMGAQGDVYLALNAAWFHVMPVMRGTSSNAAEQLLNLTKVSWDETLLVRLTVLNGEEGPKLDVGPSTTIRGRVDKQWQLDVYKGILRVIVEDWAEGKLLVTIYTLDSSTMEVIGKLEGIAINENVHGVRFMGDKLYLVTFRRVDPLFAVDLSNPQKPRVLGFLKGPGFDEYLHPISNRLLVGVGVEGGTVRISLYRILENGSVELLDRVYPVRERGWSPVLDPREGHKAFTYYPEYNVALLPLQWMVRVKATSAKGEVYYTFKPEGGVAVVEVAESDNGYALSVRGVLEHSGASRAVYVGDTVYTVAPYAEEHVPVVKAWDLRSLELIASFPRR